MKQHLPYIIGSSAVVVAATAVLSCYFSRADSQVSSTKESEKDTVTPKSRSRAVSYDPEGTTMFRTLTNPLLHPEEITLSRLQDLLKGAPGQKTIYTVVELLYNLKKGGALVVVYDFKGGKDPGAAMPVNSFAGGKLKNIMKHYAKTLFVDYSDGAPVSANFRAILDAWSSVERDGPSADTWTKPVLESMAKDLGESWESANSIRLLENQPADGALAILSLRGTVVGASSRIDIGSPQLRELKLQDSRGAAGTKHSVAVCAVEWCRLNRLQGAAIVRSDAGRLTFVCIEAIDSLNESETKTYEIVGL